MNIFKKMKKRALKSQGKMILFDDPNEIIERKSKTEGK